MGGSKRSLEERKAALQEKMQRIKALEKQEKQKEERQKVKLRQYRAQSLYRFLVWMHGEGCGSAPFDRLMETFFAEWLPANGSKSERLAWEAVGNRLEGEQEGNSPPVAGQELERSNSES